MNTSAANESAEFKINISETWVHNDRTRVVKISNYDWESYDENFVFMHLVVFVMGLVGNGLVCHLIMFSAHMRSITNLFIKNLAVVDLIIALTYGPHYITDLLSVETFGIFTTFSCFLEIFIKDTLILVRMREIFFFVFFFILVFFSFLLPYQ